MKTPTPPIIDLRAAIRKFDDEVQTAKVCNEVWVEAPDVVHDHFANHNEFFCYKGVKVSRPGKSAELEKKHLAARVGDYGAGYGKLEGGQPEDNIYDGAE